MKVCRLIAFIYALRHALGDTAKSSSNVQVVTYWGQTAGQKSLQSYCADDAGVDIILLAFLNTFGQNMDTPSGNIGSSCQITSGNAQGCEEVAADIDYCRSKGVKVILSLGGALGVYGLSSREEAETIGQNLWDAFGGVKQSRIPRPFGETFVDGWDFDIELYEGTEYYRYLIAKLRSNFATDPCHTYYITGAPQCPIPEPYMQKMITSAEFDYLWVQFYNNPSCSVNTQINYDEWVTNIANTPSANAKVFIGVPASPLAATGTESGSRYYLDPNVLATLVRQHATNPAFGGLWPGRLGIPTVIFRIVALTFRIFGG
ncbi:Chitinase 2 [Penicillium canescens]|nr:Chitinase 2 [Penicillium canescens]